MTLRARIYAQFFVAVLPLLALVAWQTLERDDMPERVSAALESYDLSLEAETAFKDFLNGVADAMDTGSLGDRGLDALRRARESLGKLAPISAADQPLAEGTAGLATALSRDASVKALLPLKAQVQSMREGILASSGAKRQALAALVQENRERVAARRRFLMAAGAGTLVLLAFMALVVRRLVNGIVGPVGETVAVAREIATGRLDNEIAVRRRDEIGQLQSEVRAMQEQLAEIVRAVRAGADSVAAASLVLSGETRSLSQRTEEHAASLEQAAASMEELSTTVKGNNAHAMEAKELSREASAAAVVGSQAVKRVVSTMEEITARSRRIEDIVGVIDGIAFQTNILALNAAVEAARAGEQGRGFAVVASEVRNLAQRAASAATEIKGLIAASVTSVESGGAQVSQAGQSIEALVEHVQRVSGLMADIAAATLEQERGIEQVSATVTQMDGVVQKDAAAVHKSAAASEKLKADAAELARIVSRFRLGFAGETAPETPPEPAPLPAPGHGLPILARRA
ncbi:MAG TPA: methyl-accepting chemotaxis protein [Usitatibacter sp.]|nr:methyl-accepting chemotaxis protein [Usitatibacter sp.]